MSSIVWKLKRFKALTYALSVIFYPIAFPFYIIYWVGKASEIVLALWTTLFTDFIRKPIVKRFNWNEIAEEQYRTNPNKFKD